MALEPLGLACALEALGPRGFREVDAEGAHVQSVQEAAEALIEAVQRLVQELQVHHVGFQVGHAVCQFAECGFERFEGEGVRGG